LSKLVGFFFQKTLGTSVIVDNLNVKRIAIRPNEANPELIIDPDTVLSYPVPPLLLRSDFLPDTLKGLVSVAKDAWWTG